MRVLFTESKVQENPSIIFALHRLGHEVARYPKPMEELEGDEEAEKELEVFLKKYKVDFVLSNTFTPLVASVTRKLSMKYAVWCMDSPMYSTWVEESKFDNCFLFYFDKRECMLQKQNGHSNVYHLPLAADTVWGEELVITDEEISKYSCDMSFVGSLYTQNVYDNAIERFMPEVQDRFSDILENSAFLWDGKERVELSEDLIQMVRRTCPDMFEHPYTMSDEYFLKSLFIDRKLTNVERTLLMEVLAEHYDIHLYTRATENVPEGVRRFPEIDAGTGALKVFYSSKINLNVTLRSIKSGIPARVFDVMSVGGFVLSNWQEEIPELFEEEKDIVTFKTPEELIEKADYYLKNDTERIRIGIRGYQKVKENYTYEHQVNKIVLILFPNARSIR